jgi:hypothetical protein
VRSFFGSRKAKFEATGLFRTIEKLKFLKSLMEAGHVKSVIDRS